jgi:peptidoglycan hydrolase-like protein with peptidoglycan-binding domain
MGRVTYFLVFTLLTFFFSTAHAAEVNDTDTQSVFKAQKFLAELNYDPGSIDGYMGPKTGSAIRAFQKDNLMPETGLVTQDLLIQLSAAILKRGHARPDNAPSLESGRATTVKELSNEEAERMMCLMLNPASQCE